MYFVVVILHSISKNQEVSQQCPDDRDKIFFGKYEDKAFRDDKQRIPTSYTYPKVLQCVKYVQ